VCSRDRPFDGCDPKTGNTLQASADIDSLFDDNDKSRWWICPEKDPELRMIKQADAALAGGNGSAGVSKHQRGFRALTKIANNLGKGNMPVVSDPNRPGTSYDGVGA
jgi:hypothetical protein